MRVLLFFTILLKVSGAPQKDLRGNDIINENADFGTPDHDNRVQTELTKLSDTEIAQLISADYFSGSTLACDNDTAPGQWMIYCSGRLLQAVMAVKLYPDSKTFVDQPMKLNMTGEAIMEEFERRFPKPIEKLTKKEVGDFVDEFFDQEGNEMETCNMPEWHPLTPRIEQISDPTYQAFAQQLHFIWIQLCRKIKTVVKDDQSRFSLLYVPHQFILPGGRFREFYYWDAYWIIKGLLGSELYTTARNMIRNFAHMIDRHGFVPNGGRVYYLRRSQPPLFAPMVYEYYLATQDVQFVTDMLPAIEREYKFWSERRTIGVTIEDVFNETISMFQYRTEASSPRPESFREDVMSAQNFKDAKRKQDFFRDIGSAAESGWDFSSRWFKDHKDLSTIETTHIVPVDLNAFICYNMNILQFFYQLTGNPLKHLEWNTQLRDFRNAFTKVFYVPSRKGWYDYNIHTGKHNTDFFPSNAVPLFAQCYDPLNSQLAVDVYNQMDKSGAFDLPGGIPTSLHKDTQQQWDFPNGWSPLNHMIIEGLRKSINPTLQQKAFKLAEKWLETSLRKFNDTTAMWEKYDVNEPNAKLATGGEYAVQAGFGWTNGAALDLIFTYSDRLKYSGPLLSALLGTPEKPKTTTKVKTSPTTSSSESSTSPHPTPSSSFSFGSPLSLALLIAVILAIW